MRLAQEAEDSDATFSPAVNDRSLRMALAKQIRELHDEVPASQRLSAARAMPAPAPGVLLMLSYVCNRLLVSCKDIYL